jgi:integrase/recombinase XerD
MSALAPVLESFFTERLIGQRQASAHTVASYRDTFRLLLGFARRQTGKTPSKLDLDDLDAVLIGAFLDHLEGERHNSVRTRNNRLAAIHSLFAYAALRHPEHAALIQRVLAIPAKRTDRQLVSFLTNNEVDALLAAPDRDTWVGRRDHALLLVAIQTGLRVSELTALTCGDVELGTGAHLRCYGKGRKERITPLTAEVCAVLRVWLAERRGGPHDAVFPSRRRGPLSSDAVAVLVTRHARTAARRCPSLVTKTVTPHVLRHTCAMRLLAVGVDISVIALWLGHEGVETTQIYLHADLVERSSILAFCDQ